MNKRNVNLKTIAIIFLIGMIIPIISVILSMKNVNIEKQIASKEQLTETSSDNTYVSMKDHLSEISELNANAGKIYKLGNGRSFDISSIVGSKNVGNYSINNFIVAWTSPSGSASTTAEETDKVYKLNIVASVATTSDYVLSYNNTTGILTITGGTYNVTVSQPAYSNIIQTNTYQNNPVVYFLDGIEVSNVNQ